ncbi:MAG: MmcQ/YjbR family DNA-binding protein [Cyclobacteriaceae bacterium]
MDIESFRDYCLKKAGVTEEFPFDNNTLVFKVMNRMFALADVDHFESINLKCDPEKALQLRERFSGIRPGYHMNKKHWNTVEMDGTVPDNLVIEMIDESYALVVAGLPPRARNELSLEDN